MTAIQKLEALTESRVFIAIYRGLMTLSVMFLVPGIIWLVSSTVAGEKWRAEFQARIERLEADSKEAEQYRLAAMLRRDEQYNNIIQRIASVESAVASIAQGRNEIRDDIRELTRRLNDRQGLLLPESEPGMPSTVTTR